MEMAAVVTAFVTLFIVIDPIGMAPIFVALTSGMSDAERRSIARRACLIALCILTVFALFGAALLSAVGISLTAFRISGGILLFLIAVEMLFERRTQRREGSIPSDSAQDPSVFPLATPLIAGPGSMATMILLVTGADQSWVQDAAMIVVMAAVVGLVYGLFLLATPIEKLLGRTGVLVVTRLLGVLLAALSVQFILDGLREAGFV
ncbi:MAG: MarC family protein [Pseudomonadota bacterium]